MRIKTRDHDVVSEGNLWIGIDYTSYVAISL